MEALQGEEINEAKKTLALEATSLCHGKQAAREAAETARATFEDKTQGAALPRCRAASAELEQGIAAFELIVQAGLAASKGEARRLIRSGGGRVNDKVIEDETQPITLADVNAEGVIKLSAGRKRHVLVEPS